MIKNYFHRDLSTPAMSTDSSQVGVTLSPFLLTYFFIIIMKITYIHIRKQTSLQNPN